TPTRPTGARGAGPASRASPKPPCATSTGPQGKRSLSSGVPREEDPVKTPRGPYAGVYGLRRQRRAGGWRGGPQGRPSGPVRARGAVLTGRGGSRRAPRGRALLWGNV